MLYIEKGDVVRIKNMPLSIHKTFKGKVGIVVGQGCCGNRKYKDIQLAISLPNHRVVYILPAHLEKVNAAR